MKLWLIHSLLFVIIPFLNPLAADVRASTSIKYDPPGYNLGSIPRSKFSKTIILHNTGKKKLRIKSIRSNCACAVVDSFDTLIPPGNSSEIKLTIDLIKEKKQKFNYIYYVSANTRPRKITSFKVSGTIASKSQQKIDSADTETDISVVLPKNQAMEQSSGSLRVVLFYSPGCSGCDVVIKALSKATRGFKNRINIEKYNIDQITNYEILIDYEKHYSSKENATLKIFVGEQYLAGPGVIVEKLNNVIAEQLKANIKTFTLDKKEERKVADSEKIPASIIHRFKSFAVIPLIIAGLVDGINPCAFTSIVFLFSFLIYLKKSRREILIVGIFFALGVFSTYLLLGFGALKAIKYFTVSNKIYRIVTYVAAAFAFFLGAISFRDYIVYKRTGKTSSMKLVLSGAVKKRIHSVMRSKLGTYNLIIGGFTVGVAISLLESICTGQVYLPTIIFVMKVPSLRLHAFLYLILYNLMFIVPLMIVIGLVFFGLSSEKLVKYTERNLGFMKICMAMIFIGLGVMLIVF